MQQALFFSFLKNPGLKNNDNKKSSRLIIDNRGNKIKAINILGFW